MRAQRSSDANTSAAAWAGEVTEKLGRGVEVGTGVGATDAGGADDVGGEAVGGVDVACGDADGAVHAAAATASEAINTIRARRVGFIAPPTPGCRLRFPRSGRKWCAVACSA